MKKHEILITQAGAIGLAVILFFGMSSALCAQGHPGSGDNRDDSRSGKADRPGDGNSGKGDDLHKGQGVSGEKAPQRRQKLREHLLKKFDADGDGKLNDEERAKMKAAVQAKKQEWLKRFDANGDGKLDSEERQKAKETVSQERFQKFAQKHPEAAKRFDANGDGKLSAEEGAAARKACKEKRGLNGKGESSDGARRGKKSGKNAYKYPSNTREYPPHPGENVATTE
ncbi:MAG: EF-hand domain-containing protein [Verrucomicrobia bacterium]|nr:EF-hand domain-containing protein [Verrucomicrobiota bacterium]